MKLKLFLILVFLLVISSSVYAEAISQNDKINILNSVLLPLVASQQTFNGYESKQSLLLDIKEVFGVDPICGILGDEKYTWDLSTNKVKERCDDEIERIVKLGISQADLFTIIQESLATQQFCVVIEGENFLLFNTETSNGFNLNDLAGFNQYCSNLPVFRYEIKYLSARVDASFQKGSINIPFTVEAGGALSSIVSSCLPIVGSPKKCSEIQSKGQDLIFLTNFDQTRTKIIEISPALRSTSSVTKIDLPSTISPIASLPSVLEDKGTTVKSQKAFNSLQDVQALINEYENLFIEFEGKQIKYQSLIERSANSQISSQALYEEALGYKSIAEMQRDYEGMEIIATTHYKGIGEQCSTDDQCKADLTCLKNVCTKKEEEVKPGQPKPTEVKDESFGLSTDYDLTAADKKILDEIELKYGSYVDIILDENPELNLIPKGLILATIWEESKGQQYTLSKVDAAGLTQLRPATARAQGLNVPEYGDRCKCTLKLCMTKDSVESDGCNIDTDDRFNVKKSIYGGMSYYKFVLNLNQIKNNWYKAISGYNSGPSSPFLSSNPQNPSLDEFPNKGYVSRVVAGWQYYSSKTSKMGCGYCASTSSKDGVDCSEEECESLGSCEWDSNNLFQSIVRNKGTCTTIKTPEKEKTAITGALCYPLPENSISSIGDKKNFADLRVNKDGSQRCHIGNDIYTKAPGDVIAIDDGELMTVSSFYTCDTATNWGLVKESKASGIVSAVLVYHPNLGVTINYGEIDSNKVKVDMNNKEIKKGQPLGVASYCGMLHFEVYDGMVKSTTNWPLTVNLLAGQKCTSSTPGKPDSVLDATAFISRQEWQSCTPNQDFTTVAQPEKEDDQITSSTIEGFCFPFEEKPNSVGGGTGIFGGSRSTDPQNCNPKNRCHNGIDIVPKGNVPTDVRAIETGTITKIGTLLSSGIIANSLSETDIAIKIFSKESGRTIMYGELKKDTTNMKFTEGQKIEKGTVLGKTIQQKYSKTMLHLETYEGENSAPIIDWWCAPADVTNCNINTPGKPEHLIDPTLFINGLNNPNGYQCKSENKVSGVSGIDFKSYATKCTDSVAPTSERMEGMMIPKGINKGDDVTVNFYFHGHKAGISQNFVSSYTQENDFWRNMEALTQAGGKEILVVLRGSNNNIPCPTQRNPGNTGDACKWMDSNNFGCYYNEAIEIIKEKGYNPTQFSLSSHSGGGKAVSNIVSSQSFKSVQDKLKEVIFYDACYGTCKSVQQSLPNTKIYIYDTGGEDTQADIAVTCNPNPDGTCKNSKVYLERLTGTGIGHGDVPTKCFLQHIIGGTCAGTSPLVASAGLPGSAGDLPKKKILFIGDSNAVGTFGQSLDKSLRTLSEVTVRTYAVGATEPASWLSGSKIYEPRNTLYIGDDGKRSQNAIKGNTPKLQDLVTQFKPNVVIIALGTNVLVQMDNTRFPGYDKIVKSNIKKLSQAAQINGAKCYWIGPPKATKYPNACIVWDAQSNSCKTSYTYTEAEMKPLMPKLNQAITENAGGCTLINAADLTASLTLNSDGIHYSGQAAQKYAENVFNDLKAKAL